MARILAISSQVVRGHVGLAATVPALQRLGHEVWALPTVLLASRPSLGRLVRHEPPPPTLAAMLAALEADGCWANLDGIFTGYFPSAESVVVAAEAIRRIKHTKPKIPVLVDPILGDAGQLYVAEEVAEAIRDALLPLATMATPNLFELEWLTGAGTCDLVGLTRAAHRLGPATVIVTSAIQSHGNISTLLVSDRECLERPYPRRAGVPSGAGDLFAGLFLGHLLIGCEVADALDASTAELDCVLAASEGREVLELSAFEASAACSGGSQS